MKKYTLILAALLFSLFISLRAEAAEVKVFDVTDYGADGTDKNSDRVAIQSALNEALKESGEIEVHIPAGTYYIDYMLDIYSDTTLILDDNATIIRTNLATGMLRSDSRDRTIGRYDRARNITIKGGTWDGGVDGSSATTKERYSLMYFHHVQNINLSDCTVKNCCSRHMIIFAAAKDITVSNANILNMYEYTGSASDFFGNASSVEYAYRSAEALHFDIVDEKGIAETADIAYPLDNTPTTNVTVKNCHFENLFAGVGGHYSSMTASEMSAKGLYGSSFTYTDNTFKNIKYTCINDHFHKNVTVSRNIAQDCSELIRTENSELTISNNALYSKNRSDTKINLFGCYILSSKATVTDNVFSNVKTHAIYFKESSGSTAKGNVVKKSLDSSIVGQLGSYTIENNIIVDPTNHGISLNGENGTTMTVKGNRVIGASYFGITIAGGKNHVVSNNYILRTAKNGLYLNNISGGTVSGNVVGNSAAHGIGVNDSSSVKLTSNKAYGNNGHGIIVKNCTNATISSNTAYGNTTRDITADSTTGTGKSNIVSKEKSKGIYSSTTGLSFTSTTVNTAKDSGLYTEGGAVTLDNGSSTIVFAAVAPYSSLSSLSFKSSAGSVASVSRGIVDAKKTGSAVITAAFGSSKKTWNINSIFIDVKDTKLYYYSPVYWAVDKGITNGFTDADGFARTFGPAEDCTRAQMITFLWRLRGKPEPKLKESPFTDIKTGDYYYKAVIWAYENGITKGYPDDNYTTFRPDNICLREHAVTFLYRAVGSPKVSGSSSGFTDVVPGDYYYKPVIWASKNGITKGYPDDNYATFRPKLNCLREHIVTFMSRASK